jgi:hypothetical protein
MSRFIRLIGLGCLSTIVCLEIIFRVLPVTTGFGYYDRIQSEPILRSALPVVKHSLDWKFHQSQTRKVNNYGFTDDRNYTPKTKPIALIGDSYVQSLMLPYSDTLQGRLGTLMHARDRSIYSFGTAGYSLAGYIGSAEYASKNFEPELFIFLLTEGDITDSLSTKIAGTYLLDSPGLDLKFEPSKPNRINQLMLKSALMRYLKLHLQFDPIAGLKKPTHPQPNNSLTDREHLSHLSNRLLDYLEQKSTARSNNTIFIIDCDREKIYHHQPQAQTTPDNQLAVFAEIAQDRGYRTIDTLPLFTTRYQQTHRRIDFTPIDMHWNRDAHQLVAEAIYPVVTAKLGVRN